jgi:protein-tyrosine phosphatase
MKRFSFDWIEPQLAIAGSPHSAQDVQDANFDFILDVRDTPHPDYAAAGLAESMQTLHIPMEDGLPMPSALIRRAVLELAHTQRCGLSTLVHCRAGQSRSVAVVAVFLMGRDSLSWEQANQRIKQSRLQANPHPKLLEPALRESIANQVRAYLGGDGQLLTEARQSAESLLLRDRTRQGLGAAGKDWDWIEEGFALGVAPSALVELVAMPKVVYVAVGVNKLERFREQLADFGEEMVTLAMNEDGPVDWRKLDAMAQQILQWRKMGRTVFIHCEDGKSRSALLLARCFMLAYQWDFAAAMWYIRRRRGAWPRPLLLEGKRLQGMWDV